MGGRLVLLLVGAALVAAPAPAVARERLDVGVFARVPSPGSPEPVALGSDRTVYVGTNQFGKGGPGNADAPSRVFAYSPTGKLLRSYVLKGQDLSEDHGIQGLAIDGRDLIYVLDRAANPRIVLLDPETGAQRDYVAFRDVPSCAAAGRTTDCSATGGDKPAGPDYVAFAPDGTLYVTDIDQALIWRVPKGGGRPEVWFTDPRLESPFGPNGIQVMADGRTLLFVVTSENGSTTGALYKLPVRPDGRPGALSLFWRTRSLDGPDGFALARSGNVYLALAAANQVALISPSGQELARVPATPAQNAQQEVPFDFPASAAFLGESVLVTNQSFPVGIPTSWAVLDVFAGEPGLPLFRPFAATRPTSSARIRLSVRPRRVRRGRRVRFRFRATAAGEPIWRARIAFGGRHARANRRGRAAITVRLGRPGRHLARAGKGGLRKGRVAIRVRSRR
jgi:SMP-30/gluconolaconase/LRE-like protein